MSLITSAITLVRDLLSHALKFNDNRKGHPWTNSGMTRIKMHRSSTSNSMKFSVYESPSVLNLWLHWRDPWMNLVHSLSRLHPSEFRASFWFGILISIVNRSSIMVKPSHPQLSFLQNCFQTRIHRSNKALLSNRRDLIKDWIWNTQLVHRADQNNGVWWIEWVKLSLALLVTHPNCADWNEVVLFLSTYFSTDTVHAFNTVWEIERGPLSGLPHPTKDHRTLSYHLSPQKLKALSTSLDHAPIHRGCQTGSLHGGVAICQPPAQTLLCL